MKNKNKKFGLILFILLFFSVISLISVSAVDVETFTEMNDAINNQNENVTLKHDIVVTDEDIGNVGNNGIIISRNVTVDGDGHYIDGKHKVRFFNITSSGAILTLKNIKLMNGNSTKGGAISSDNDLNLICIGTVTFTNNIAKYYGGSISTVNKYSNVNINADKIIFNNNTADYNGGAIRSDNDVNIIVNKIEFTDNTAGWDGDAIQSEKKVFINCFDLICNNNSIFAYNNVTIISNGSISFNDGRIESYKGNLNITAINKIEFNDNIVTGNGGAINAKYNVNIKCNGNVIFNNNTATESGGAIHCLNGNVDINALNLIFTNNKAENNGGAISSGGNININTNYVEFKDNIAENEGGAISVSNEVIIISKSNVTFIDNYANGTGGCIYANGDNGNVNIDANNNVNFINNFANYAGAIYIGSNSHLFITNGAVNFYNNNNCAIVSSFNCNILINSSNNVTFINNNGGNNKGGAIQIDIDVIGQLSNSIIIVAKSVNFINNVASSGGAICIPHGEVVIYSNNIFLINNSVSGRGAVIYSAFGRVSFFTSNLIGSDNVANGFYEGASFDTIEDVIYLNEKSISYTEFGRYYHFTDSKISLTAHDLIMNYKDGSKFTVELKNGSTPLEGKTIKIVINGQTYERITDSNGIASMNINLVPGFYPVTATYEDLTSNAKIEVYGKSTLTASDISVVPNKIFIFSAVLKDYDGNAFINQNIKFLVNGQEYNAVTDSNGKASVDLQFDIGNYTIVSTYAGSTYISGSDSTNKIIVQEKAIILTANDLTMYYKDGSKFTVELKDGSSPLAGKTIDIILNGNTYQRVTDSNGIASMNINLDVGTYSVTANYEGLTSNANINVKSTISGDNVTKIYKNGTQYSAKFLDNKGNPLVNTDVQFNINGVFYTRTTDNTGVARMNINLQPNTYVLTATNPVNGQLYSNTITVLTSITGKDVTKIYKNDTQYHATFYNSDGSLLRNTDVQFNINGVFYTRTTDSNGIATMKINLVPGTYVITAVNPVNGELHSNKITVLPIIIANDLYMKYHDGSKFTAKLIDGSGNPVVGKELKFNVNGVFYYKTTDSNGEARLTINLNPGDYIITSEYDGFMTSNKISISN